MFAPEVKDSDVVLESENSPTLSYRSSVESTHPHTQSLDSFPLSFPIGPTQLSPSEKQLLGETTAKENARLLGQHLGRHLGEEFELSAEFKLQLAESFISGVAQPFAGQSSWEGHSVVRSIPKNSLQALTTGSLDSAKSELEQQRERDSGTVLVLPLVHNTPGTLNGSCAQGR